MDQKHTKKLRMKRLGNAYVKHPILFAAPLSSKIKTEPIPGVFDLSKGQFYIIMQNLYKAIHNLEYYTYF